MKIKYYSIKQMLDMVDEPDRSVCLKILSSNEELFRKVQGSSHNHQNWAGGYYDHILEVMNISILLYVCMNNARQLKFSLSDALFILFLHDIEKPWKYDLDSDGEIQIIESLRDKDKQKEFRSKKLKEYGIKLNPDQENAMKYVEGEYKDYSPKRRTMNPLAAFCNLCDVTSGRIWFENPLKEEDPWGEQ